MAGIIRCGMPRHSFSELIFKQVIHNVMLVKSEQTFDVILFRPILPYIALLNLIKGFRLIKIEKYDSMDAIRNDIEFYLYRFSAV